MSHTRLYSLLLPRQSIAHCGRYSFRVPLRVGGYVGLGGWLNAEVIRPSEDSHPSQY